jgi:antitoxin CcdA
MPRTATARRPDAPTLRRATNVTLPDALLREARDLEVNLSQACEAGLTAEVAAAKARRWLAENQAALEAWNEHVERHGLPLSEFRSF